MSNEVVTFGIGSFAETLHFYLTHDSAHREVICTADKNYISEGKYLGLPIVFLTQLQNQS